MVFSQQIDKFKLFRTNRLGMGLARTQLYCSLCMPMHVLTVRLSLSDFLTLYSHLTTQKIIINIIKIYHYKISFIRKSNYFK